MTVQLYPHQTKALEETKQFNRVGYFLDMGLGKTFVGSEKAIKDLTQTNVLLLVCQKSKIPDWIEHFQTYYATHDRDYCTKELIFDLTTKKGFEGFVAESIEATTPDFIEDNQHYVLIFHI